MSLSEQEQKVLEELERQLSGAKESKPKVAPTETSAKYAKRLVLGSAMLVIGLGLLIFATSLHQIAFGLLAFVMMLLGLYFISQNWSGRAIRAANSGKKPSKDRPSGSFFQDRWDKRNQD